MRVDEDDRETVALFHHLMQRQAALTDRVERAQRARAQAKSVMAADNASTNPVQIEHFVSYCLLQAVDAARVMPRVVRSGDGEVELPIMALSRSHAPRLSVLLSRRGS